MATDTSGQGHAAISILTGLLILLRERGTLSRQDLDVILDGALLTAEQMQSTMNPADAAVLASSRMWVESIAASIRSTE